MLTTIKKKKKKEPNMKLISRDIWGNDLMEENQGKEHAPSAS